MTSLRKLKKHIKIEWCVNCALLCTEDIPQRLLFTHAIIHKLADLPRSEYFFENVNHTLKAFKINLSLIKRTTSLDILNYENWNFFKHFIEIQLDNNDFEFKVIDLIISEDTLTVLLKED